MIKLFAFNTTSLFNLNSTIPEFVFTVLVLVFAVLVHVGLEVALGQRTAAHHARRATYAVSALLKLAIVGNHETALNGTGEELVKHDARVRVLQRQCTWSRNVYGPKRLHSRMVHTNGPFERSVYRTIREWHGCGSDYRPGYGYICERNGCEKSFRL